MERKNIQEALKKLKENKKRNFDQSIDLIVNLKNYNAKKNPLNLWIDLPHKIKDVKIAGFLEKKSDKVATITEDQLKSYGKDKKKAKNLAKEYDFFISIGKLMPKVASTLGKYLGPKGKMPSPQMGLLQKGDDNEIDILVKRLNKTLRIRSEVPSIKFCIGKENMKDEEIAENIKTAYEKIVKTLPNKKENIKSVMLKLTMSKPIKLEK